MMRHVRAGLAFTDVVLRSLLRDRQALFFMLVMPVIVIVIVGTTFGGAGTIDVGVVNTDDGVVATRTVAALEATDGIDVTIYENEEDVAAAVRRSHVSAGLVLAAGLDGDLAAGRVAAIRFVAGTLDSNVLTVKLAVQGVVDDLAARFGAASFVSERVGVPFAGGLEAADSAATSGGISIVTSDVGTGRARSLSEFSYVVPQNLVLFTFINALASAAFLVQIRRDGVLHRALSTRTSAATLLGGLTLGWFALALFQASAIVVIGRVAFDVRWGDPAGVTVLLVLWALVGCGGGVLVGALADNIDRTGALMPVVGIVLGALGGCMVPFEVFPPVMRAVALAVPHTWALNGFRNLVFDGGGLADIAGSIAVLAAWAIGSLTLSTVVMRRRLVRS
ncbi:MAG: ABC transporter permease [Acidimicrobiia bacterium]